MRRLAIAALAAAALAVLPARADSPAWPDATRSPAPTTTDPLTTACGEADAALASVAKRLLDRKLRGLATPDSSELTGWLRAAGSPHVWPRALVVSGRALDDDRAKAKIAEWAAQSSDAGTRRCGVASGARGDGARVVVAVGVTAAADLDALPSRGRPGQFLSVSARLHVAATAARVVVMGPYGAPYTVPSSLHDGRVRARFAPTTSGPFVVQVVADLDSGPRPVVEAIVFSDTAPSESATERAAPGEDASAAGDPADALERMLNAARVADGKKPLARDPRLDALARAHVRRAARARATLHDAGDGDPEARLLAAGLRAKLIGENVAHASSVALAHRTLYASASHRANLLSDDFDAFGVAVVFDDDGSAWTVEMFARGLR